MNDKFFISVKSLLDTALENLLSAVTWSNSRNFDIAHSHMQTAESIISIIEVHDCGSIGGFGEGQQLDGNEGGCMYSDKYDTRFARLIWLYKKYTGIDLLKITPRSVLKYWKVIH